MATKKKTDAKASEQTESKKTEAGAAKEPKADKPAKPAKDEQNGVSRPSSGATRRVWEIADEISGKTGEPATRAAVTEVAEKEGLVLGTIHTQYGRWRKYNGLVTPKDERQAATAAKKADKEAKAAEKAKGKETPAKEEPAEEGQPQEEAAE